MKSHTKEYRKKYYQTHRLHYLDLYQKNKEYRQNYQRLYWRFNKKPLVKKPLKPLPNLFKTYPKKHYLIITKNHTTICFD